MIEAGFGETTLQLNLSPGDIHYALQVVPHLVASHRNYVTRVVAVVDCCRPQRTKIYDPDVRVPLQVHGDRVQAILAIANTLKADGWLDEVYPLSADDPRIESVLRKYVGKMAHGVTHDFGGCGLVSYFYGIDVCKTRHVLHYDADVLLFQKTGYDWVGEGLQRMRSEPSVLAVSPRISPPVPGIDLAEDAPSLHEGRSLTPCDGGWLNDWFSTRCFLLDRDRLDQFLPLGESSHRLKLELYVRRALGKGFPLSPEIMLFKGPGRRGAKRLNLSTPNAWLLHPTTKPSSYLEILPALIPQVEKGRFPAEQAGQSEINIDAWQKFLVESGGSQ